MKIYRTSIKTDHIGPEMQWHAFYTKKPPTWPVIRRAIAKRILDCDTDIMKDDVDHAEIALARMRLRLLQVVIPRSSQHEVNPDDISFDWRVEIHEVEVL